MKKTITKEIKIKTNLDEINKKVDELKQKLEEANALIQELASTDLEVNLDV